MSHNFPQNRDDIGVVIFPHEDLIKRGDPGYYHYVPALAMYGDKHQKKPVSPGSGSSKVEVRRNDFNSVQSPSHVHVTTSPVHSFETSPDYSMRQETKHVEKKLDLDAIEDHLRHHGRLEKLDDFNVDVTPSPMQEDSPFFHQQHVSDAIREVETREHEYSHSGEHDQPIHVHQQEQHVPLIKFEEEEDVPRHHHEQDEYGYEVVNETHTDGHDHGTVGETHTGEHRYGVLSQTSTGIHERSPEVDVHDTLLQNVLQKKYSGGDEDATAVVQKIEEYEKKHGGDHSHHDEHSNQHHIEHHVKFEESGPHVADQHDSAEPVKHEIFQEAVKQHIHKEYMTHPVNDEPVEKYGASSEIHQHKDEHTMEHHVQHHNIKQEESSLQQRSPQEHRSVFQEVNYGVDTHQQAFDEPPREHDVELNPVKKMVSEHEKKHKDGHSMEHHIQHHKAKQAAQEYQTRETTVELLHERHEVRLNIEVKPQSATHHDTAHTEPKTNTVYMELKQDTTPTRPVVEQQYNETWHQVSQNTRTEHHHTETYQVDTSPLSRRIDQQYPDIDSPTKVKTDAIIAQLKSVGVDAGGVKTLKDLKEEKKLSTIRKEEEVKSEIERIKREYTAEKFMNMSPTHGGKTGFELPEWKRRQIAQKKADEAVKVEEARLWKEFEEWKLGQSPSWVKDVKQRKSIGGQQ